MCVGGPDVPNNLLILHIHLLSLKCSIRYQNTHDLLFRCIDKVIITELSNADKEALEQDHHDGRNGNAEWHLESE